MMRGRHQWEHFALPVSCSNLSDVAEERSSRGNSGSTRDGEYEKRDAEESGEDNSAGGNRAVASSPPRRRHSIISSTIMRASFEAAAEESDRRINGGSEREEEDKQREGGRLGGDYSVGFSSPPRWRRSTTTILPAPGGASKADPSASKLQRSDSLVLRAGCSSLIVERGTWERQEEALPGPAAGEPEEAAEQQRQQRFTENFVHKSASFSARGAVTASAAYRRRLAAAAAEQQPQRRFTESFAHKSASFSARGTVTASAAHRGRLAAAAAPRGRSPSLSSLMSFSRLMPAFRRRRRQEDQHQQQQEQKVEDERYWKRRQHQQKLDEVWQTRRHSFYSPSSPPDTADVDIMSDTSSSDGSCATAWSVLDVAGVLLAGPDASVGNSKQEGGEHTAGQPHRAEEQHDEQGQQLQQQQPRGWWRNIASSSDKIHPVPAGARDGWGELPPRRYSSFN